MLILNELGLSWPTASLPLEQNVYGGLTIGPLVEGWGKRLVDMELERKKTVEFN